MILTPPWADDFDGALQLLAFEAAKTATPGALSKARKPAEA
jgi:hypothetical protein